MWASWARYSGSTFAHSGLPLLEARVPFLSASGRLPGSGHRVRFWGGGGVEVLGDRAWGGFWFGLVWFGLGWVGMECRELIRGGRSDERGMGGALVGRMDWRL